MELRVEGIKETINQLKKLPNRNSKAVYKAATRAGGKAIIKNIRSMVPKDTGVLSKSIGQKVIKMRGTNGYVSIIGVMVDFEKGGKRPSKYSSLVEKRKPFIVQALKVSEKSAVTSIAKKMKSGIIKEAIKLRGK